MVDGDGNRTSTVVFTLPDAHGRRQPIYVLVLGKTAARVVPLPGDGDYLIGRATDVAIQLDEAAVSRHHAQISVRDGRASIRDLD
ncbi:MAG TPA: FHA domain-containing protein, partial [Kofleriaceae bacterium]|nr:FHA domain-containing protein [Kofleriaceae bacterium]